jgi:signal transduction histidine kinase
MLPEARIAQLEAEAARHQRLLALAFRLTGLGTQASAVAPLVRGILEEAVPALEVDVAMIHLVADHDLRLAGLHSRPAADESVLATLSSMPIEGESLSSRAVRERRTVHPGAEEWPRDTAARARARHGRRGIASPLVIEDRVIGSVCFVRRTDRPFLPDEAQLIESCAAHIGVAIEHVRLLEAERQRTRDLGLINGLGALLATKLDLSDLLETGVRQVSLLTSVPNTFLLLLAGDHLRMVASNVPGAMDVVFSPDDPNLGMLALREGRPLIANEASSDPRVSQQHVERFGHRAVLAVPLFARGEPLGALILGERRPDRRFSSAEIDRAVAMSNQLAAAISNARLFEDLKTSYANLERAQQQLVQRERLAALGEIAAVMAHEIRNPLAVIFNSLATLRRKPPEAAMLLDIVAEEAERLNRIVSDLLAFARPSEPRLVRESLEAVLAGATEAATAALGCKVLLEIPRALPLLQLDPQLMRQAVINLLSNAAQARPGGAVTVRAIARPDGWACVEVSDEGPGIGEAIAGQIFQPFFTARPQGTGLGLAIVKRIAEAHGGRIDFRAGTPCGTTFTLSFPIRDLPA